MKFKAVVTLLAQRQRRVQRDGEKDEEDETRGWTMYSIYVVVAYRPRISLRARARARASGIFDVLFIICLSHHLLGPADLCM